MCESPYGRIARHGAGGKGPNRTDVRVRSGEGETGVLRVISWVELALVERAMACNRIDVRVWDRWRVGSLRSEEHTSELQSLMRISYAVFCLNNKTQDHNNLSTYVC